MNNEDRMKNNMIYNASRDGLFEKRLENKKKIFRFNNYDPEKWHDAMEYLKEILGKTGKNIYIESPFHCDYGENIEVGENFYANYNLVILDCAKVKIGSDVFIAPNVSIYTAGHPVNPAIRNLGLEYAIDVTIGDSVWIGGNAVILPGVNIGSNCVIGAGSVVTSDIPDNCVAVGNPCRVIKSIDDIPPQFYFKDKKIDKEMWEEIKNNL